MYKVFIQNIPVYFVKKTTGFTIDTIHYNSDYDFMELHSNISEMHPNGVEFICKKVKKTWKTFKSNFKLIKAGGGLVFNEKGEILFIFRLNKWDLPKGKLDKGETIEECAVREVMEECNLKDISLHEKICKTFHTYTTSKNYMIKKSYWFRMTVSGKQKLIPQTQENITAVKWFKPEKLEKPLSNTYAAIAEVIDQIELVNLDSTD